MFQELLTILLIFLSYLFFQAPSDTVSSPVSEQVFAEVVRVIDGDTIDVLIDEKIERVRYIGIDTPELYEGEDPECFSGESSKENERLVKGETVRLIADLEDKDKYSRLLRYVYVGDTFVNAELLRDGFAVALPIEPNITHAREFKKYQTQAKKSRKGLWSKCR